MDEPARLRGVVDTIHDAFHRPRTPSYRFIDSAVWALIVLSIALLLLEPFLSPTQLELVHAVDRVILALFTIELALRVLTFRPPDLDVFRRPPLGIIRTQIVSRVLFLLRPTQLIDLLTIVAVIPALRGLRALRLLRLFRTVRVFKYGNPFRGLLSAFEADRLLFLFAFSILLVETILGGASLYLVERGAPDAQVDSLAEGCWWALVTLTTVGYGDYAPVTDLGRVIGASLMIGGMFTLALFAGIVGHSLLHAVLSIREEQFRMSGYVKHVIVCGYERGGELLLRSLDEELDLDEQRVVLFANRPRPPEVPPEFLWVQGDPSKESEMAKVRLAHAKSVIVVGSRQVSPPQADAQSILTVFTIRSWLQKEKSARDRKEPLHIVAEILDTENVTHARAAGADEVIESLRLGFSMLSHTVRYPGVGDLTSQVVSSGAASFYVGQRPSGLGDSVTFGELSRAVRERTSALVIGLRDPRTGAQQINPPDEHVVRAGMQVVYLAEAPTLESSRESLFIHRGT